jgi:hypothetical protein
MASGYFRGSRLNPLIALVFLLFLASNQAQGNINLELRPANANAAVGNTINLGLYAVSDSASDQLLAAVHAIITWDTSYVQLLGLNNAGAVSLLSSAFGPEPYHLNTSITDGDAMWIGLSPLGAANAVHATPSGTLLTTFQFQALANTAPTTLVNIVLSAGNPVGHSIVYDGTVPNTNVTGTLSGSVITVGVTCPPDLDHNQLVDIDDLVIVITHWGNCPGRPQPCTGNVNGDAFVNIDDLVLVITAWGMCP